MSNLIQKNIDQIIRTKTTLSGTERFPGRDATGDFKITLANFITSISDFLIGQRVGTRIFTEEDITISATDPYFNLSNQTQTLSEANFPDYIDYLRALQAKIKFTSTYETTCSCSGTTLTLAASKTWTKGQELFFNGQFRTVISGSGTSYTLDEPMTVSAGTALWSISRASTLSNFPITHYSVSSNVVSLYMNNGATASQVENLQMLKALADDYYFDKEYRTITLPNSIGSGAYTVAAGTYQLLSVTPANVGTSSAVLTFSATASDIGSTSLTGAVVTFYPRRIAGSDTTARHYQILDMAIMTGGMYGVTGYRSRDAMVGHWHYRNTQQSIEYILGPSGDGVREYTAGQVQMKVITVTGNAHSDGTNPTPNTGPITRPRSSNVNVYEYVGTYVAS